MSLFICHHIKSLIHLLK
uniref:Uncharacterized protein n=1 Tax=Lepeophtheirus salmonis TaxID=72036 RepID=A0A0K2TL56_LEPSM